MWNFIKVIFLFILYSYVTYISIDYRFLILNIKHISYIAWIHRSLIYLKYLATYILFWVIETKKNMKESSRIRVQDF